MRKKKTKSTNKDRQVKPWFVYLISTGSRTYIGSTTDVNRRLRQHNGEIKGGARATSRFPGKWSMIAYLSGFTDRSSACRWESIVKKRASGLEPRYYAMSLVARGDCPPTRRGTAKYYEPPKGLTFVNDGDLP